MDKKWSSVFGVEEYTHRQIMVLIGQREDQQEMSTETGELRLILTEVLFSLVLKTKGCGHLMIQVLVGQREYQQEMSTETGEDWQLILMEAF